MARQVDATQGRVILIVEAGEHDPLAGGAGRGGGTEHRVGARNHGVCIVGDQHHRRGAACRFILQVPVVHPGLADVSHRVVALEHDGVAFRHRGCPREYLETNAGEFGDLEEGERRDIAQFGGAGDQWAEGIGVDPRGSGPGLSPIVQQISPHRLVIAAGGNGVRVHVDARKGRRLDEGGVQVVGIRHRDGAVEDADDFTIVDSHVAGIDTVSRLPQRRPTPAARPDDHQPVHIHRGLVVAVEVSHLERRHQVIVVHHRSPVERRPGLGRGRSSRHDCSDPHHYKQ